MTKRSVGGYAMRQEITRARNANRAARESLRRLMDDQPGVQLQAVLIARAAGALAENLDAIGEIERIMNETPE